MWIVRLDPPNTRIHGKGNFHHFVERRLVAGRTERAVVRFFMYGLEGLRDIEDTSATWAKHVPGQVEQTKPPRMQEAANRFLFVEASFVGERQHVDPT